MPSNKSAGLGGAKQTPMPGPKSAKYKKIVAAAKGAAGAKPGNTKGKKRPKATGAYSTVESRQRALERMKRTIWGHLDDINAGIIRLATAGNYMAAKALFEIAGVFNLPAPDDEPKGTTAVAAATSEGDPAVVDPVDAFFKSIGIDPPCEEPAPDVAA